MLMRTRVWPNVERYFRLLDFRGGHGVDGQEFQNFFFVIRNNGGTLEHCFFGDYSMTTAPAYANRIRNVRTDLVFLSTPTVSGAQACVGGAGIASNVIVFDTAPQNALTQWTNVVVELYDGNVARPRPGLAFTSRAVGGATFRRPEITLTNDLSGLAFTINTTNIPAGKFLGVRFMGAIA